METMHLYRIDYKDRGPLVCLKPKVPETRLPSEDAMTPRVCAAPTILQCIYSKMLFLSENLWKSGRMKFFVYECDAPVEFITQPTECEVDDVWITSEMWVTKPLLWHRKGTYCMKVGKTLVPKSRHVQYFVNSFDFDPLDLDTTFGLDGCSHSFVFNEIKPSERALQAMKRR